MKKYIAFFMLFILVFSLLACNTVAEEPKTNVDENIPPKQNDIDLGSSDYSLHFSTLDEFENYISDKENQRPYYKVDNEAYIDFNSIVPNSEIVNIHIMGNNYYLYRYYAENQTDIYTGFGIQVNKEEDNRTQIERGINNGVFNETPYCSIDELREITPTDRQYTYSKIGNHTLLWYDSNIDESDDFSGLGLYVGDYCITFFWEADYTKDDYTPTQYEFLSTIVPAYGATNDSVIEMLNKIKALIPTGDEANGAQINASADASFELDSTNPIDTPSSDDSGNSEQTAGETVADTDVTDTPVNEEEEEYLYPEDYEFPVIPGISPDWKPNRNGKYPLKDGYTREEMTLIVACAIELDFGDMTDEEISKIDFIIIDDEEETEETEVPEEPEE